MEMYAGMDSLVQQPLLSTHGLERHPLAISLAFGSSGTCGQVGHFAGGVHEAFLPAKGKWQPFAVLRLGALCQGYCQCKPNWYGETCSVSCPRCSLVASSDPKLVLIPCDTLPQLQATSFAGVGEAKLWAFPRA